MKTLNIVYNYILDYLILTYYILELVSPHVYFLSIVVSIKPST